MQLGIRPKDAIMKQLVGAVSLAVQLGNCMSPWPATPGRRRWVQRETLSATSNIPVDCLAPGYATDGILHC